MAIVTIIGAGSVSFTQTLVSDLLQQEETKDCELRLHDIDPEALRAAQTLVERMRLELRSPSCGPVRASTDLRKSVAGSDYVICTVLVGGREAAVRDFEVTSRFGLRFTVGDTLGIAGISRAIRTIPVLKHVADVCSDVAPNALLFNYTNPMGMLVSAVGRSTGFPTIGLCHGTAYTVKTLAEYLQIPSEDIEWTSAGINHLAWLLTLSVQGRDLYPELASVASRPEIYNRDRVRFDLMKRFGYFTTESSKHVAEYLGFYVTRPSEIDRLAIPIDEFLGRRPIPISKQLDLMQTAGSLLRPRSNEYAPPLIAALESNGHMAFQGNVMNDHLIDDLVQDMCVEVPCFAIRGTVTPTRVGRLPAGVGALTRQSHSVQELAVDGVLKGDRDYLYQAALMDPQTASVLDVNQICELVDLLVEGDPRFRSGRLESFAGVGTPFEQTAATERRPARTKANS